MQEAAASPQKFNQRYTTWPNILKPEIYRCNQGPPIQILGYRSKGQISRVGVEVAGGV